MYNPYPNHDYFKYFLSQIINELIRMYYIPNYSGQYHKAIYK